MLEHRVRLEGSDVLDLFAGSGSLGLEALSRGARHALFVEQGRAAASLLEHNIAALGCAAEADVLRMDAMGFLRKPSGIYDLIFADPPYAFAGTSAIPELVFSGRLLNEGGYLLIEHAPEVRFEPEGLYVPGPEKKFGRTLVTFFRHSDPS
jgi:16S rRNA (guanine966-N2)-methyltransferase